MKPAFLCQTSITGVSDLDSAGLYDNLNDNLLGTVTCLKLFQDHSGGLLPSVQ